MSRLSKDKIFLALKIVIGAVIAFTVTMVIIKLFPWFVSLKDAEVREEFLEYLTSLGAEGFLVMVGIQTLQVILAILPGEPIEVLAGTMYGTWGGLAICLIGLCIGTFTIYFLVKLLGKRFVNILFSEKNVKRFSFLSDNKKLEIVMFILFFIPGTPKDLLTYIAPLTPIKPLHYFCISIFARIPSVVSSTYAGATITDGDYAKTIIVFAITGTLGLLGIIFNNKIIELLRKIKHKAIHK